MSRAELERQAAELCKDLIKQSDDDGLKQIIRRLIHYRVNEVFGATVHRHQVFQK